MLSVIVATMWRYEPFKQFVSDLSLLDCVGEIILIDNDKSLSPVISDQFWKNPKLRKVSCSVNIYVNPAYNLGVSLAKYDYICIFNDDVVADFKIFLKSLKFIKENANVGLVGVCPGNGVGQPPFENGTAEIVPWIPPSETNTHGNYFGFGTLFFMKKENWIDIPNDIKIYFGDDWIFQSQLFRNRKNYLIQNVFYNTPSAQTCLKVFTDEERQKIYDSDMKLYNKYFSFISK